MSAPSNSTRDSSSCFTSALSLEWPGLLPRAFLTAQMLPQTHTQRLLNWTCRSCFIPWAMAAAPELHEECVLRIRLKTKKASQGTAVPSAFLYWLQQLSPKHLLRLYCWQSCIPIEVTQPWHNQMPSEQRSMNPTQGSANPRGC